MSENQEAEKKLETLVAKMCGSLTSDASKYSECQQACLTWLNSAEERPSLMKSLASKLGVEEAAVDKAFEQTWLESNAFQQIQKKPIEPVPAPEETQENPPS